MGKFAFLSLALLSLQAVFVHAEEPAVSDFIALRIAPLFL